MDEKIVHKLEVVYFCGRRTHKSSSPGNLNVGKFFPHWMIKRRKYGEEKRGMQTRESKMN